MKEKLYLILGSVGIGLASLAITLIIYNVKLAKINKAQKTNYEVVKVDEPKDTEIKIDERLTDAQKEVAKNLIAKLDELSKNNNNAKENLDDEDKEPEIKMPEIETSKTQKDINEVQEKINEPDENMEPIEVIETLAKPNKNDKFLFPTSGEIGMDFSNDKLIFSSTLEEWIVHNGIDIINDKGTPVYAAKDGKIEKMYEDIKYGYTITISHDNGYITKYSGIAKNDSLKLGDSVKKGDLISKISEAHGFEMDEGSHLHFEVLKDGAYIKPEFGG